MTRFPALICALIGSFAGQMASAQDVTPAAQKGVFEGTIGRYPIVVCFDVRHSGDGFGSYYYLSQRKPIPLAANPTGNRWSEGSVFEFSGDGEKPVWDVRRIDEDTITGSWRDTKRNYPIKLTRIADADEKYEAACASADFLRPRVEKASFIMRPASIDGLDYTKLDYETPAHFAEVSISGFTFEVNQPGDPAIVAKLYAMLPSGNTQDEFVQCLAGSLAWLGTDGDFENHVQPTFANDQLLSFETMNGSYCGGAHPNYWQEYFLYDRQTGFEIDPYRWFNETGLQQTDYDATIMQAPLRDAIMEHWPSDVEPECTSTVSKEEFWRFQLLARGISFQPDLPHVMTVCEEQIVLTWDEVAPFLSEEGRSIRKRAEQ